MADHIVLNDLRDGYVKLVEWVKYEGKRTSPRGYGTREITDALVTLANPYDAMPVGVGRKVDPAIGMGEALLLVGGISDPTFMVSISRNFRRFLDGGVLHGAYGPRLRPQLAEAARRLQRDHDSRQAVVTVWDPAVDGSSETPRDLPCTVALNFRIRNGRLELNTHMRSNDVWLGVAYDFFMFTQLQITMANALNVLAGPYTHFANSLHLYDRNAPATDDLHQADEPADKFITGFGERNLAEVDAGDYWLQLADRARTVHAGKLPQGPPATPTEEWYHRSLAPYDRLLSIENFTK